MQRDNSFSTGYEYRKVIKTLFKNYTELFDTVSQIVITKFIKPSCTSKDTYFFQRIWIFYYKVHLYSSRICYVMITFDRNLQREIRTTQKYICSKKYKKQFTLNDSFKNFHLQYNTLTH